MSDLAQKIIDIVTDPMEQALRPDMLAAGLRAVMNLHTRSEAQRTFGDRRPVCFACDDGRSRPVWPCPTITLVASAMGVPAALGVCEDGKD